MIARETSLTLAAFDAVVMATWSDWKTEPRSNRYHYAVRFARHLPVFFIQTDAPGDAVGFESTEIENVTIVHCPAHWRGTAFQPLVDALRVRGVRRPLAWIYNVFLEDFVSRLAPVFSVYHATEDYLTPPDQVKITTGDISDDVRRCLASVDLVVAVSEGVANSYRVHGRYRGDLLLLPNGCDFEFWDASGAAEYLPPEDGRKVAIFQGGVNNRLDYGLLHDLARLRTDWDFWFCGRVNEPSGAWQRLAALPNVRGFGHCESARIAQLSRHALVGLIPFHDDGMMRRSLPLKAFEYVACGLPVVSTPVDALAGRPDLFTIATSAAEFAAALDEQAKTRTDAPALTMRRKAADAASYDRRFAELLAAIAAGLERRRRVRPRLNILMLYDDRSTHVGTVREHLEAFRSYSRHNVVFMPATGIMPGFDQPDGVRFDAFDAVAIHYSVRVSVPDHFSPGVADAVSRYVGPKLLFIQDEYESTELARSWMERLGVDAAFTNVPSGSLSDVYPPDRFGTVDFLPTLTGYVPEDPAIDLFAQPIEQRTVLIGYRGRALPHHYGELGYDKYRIGVDVRKLAEERGLPVDIEVDDSRRIYGLDWYRFMGSVRATLGTESGSNVFDFDGSLKALAAKHADMQYHEFADRFLREHEGKVRMNQVSPKIFEAIRLRTALVLFEGGYSGVVEPGRHYIPLKKDYSNFAEVCEKITDVGYIRDLTERAFDEVIGTGRFSYEQFVRGVDAYVERRALGRRRAVMVSTPRIILHSAHAEAAVPAALGPLMADELWSSAFSRELALAIHERIYPPPASTSHGEQAPSGVSIPAVAEVAGARGPVYGALRAAWRLLPAALRFRIASWLLARRL